MGAETKPLATISYVTDTDVSYYEIGEVEGSFNKEQLKDYVRRFGHEKLCSHLAFLQFQVWEALREVNSEKDSPKEPLGSKWPVSLTEKDLECPPKKAEFINLK